MQYDIRYDKEEGLFKFGGTPRIAVSNCAVGESTAITFRGVLIDLKTQSNVMAAIEAADILTRIGLTDPMEIKKLLDRVVAAKAANAKIPEKKETSQKK